MKHLLLFLTLIVVATSCGNDELEDVVQQEPQINTTLAFNSKAEFLEVVSKLSSMNDNEKKEWVSNQYGKFTSLMDVYLQAITEAQDLGESETEVMNYKNKYEDKLYFPCYKEDFGPYLPISDYSCAYLADEKGNVVIAGDTVSLVDIQNYTQLQQTGLAMYDADSDKNMVETRSTSTLKTFHLSEKGSSVGDEYDSGWYKNNGKKIRLKCGLQSDYFDSNTFISTLRVHVEVSFRKHTWAGYVNYSSKTRLTGTFSGGYTKTVDDSKSEDSSHDYYYTGVTPSRELKLTSTGKTYPVYQMNEIVCNLCVEYRGMSDKRNYSFTLPTIEYSAY